MPITNKDAGKLAENVVTDVNANVAIEVEKARKISPEAALLFNKSVIARPLMVPEVCSIRVKNLEYRYRWVNKGGQNGRLYTMRRAQGFVNATPEDVEILGGDAAQDNGTITAGDLILMKIRADIYDAAIKYNMRKAHDAQNMRGVYMEGGSPDVFDDSTPKRASVANEPFARSGLAKPFIPENPDAIVNDSMQSGRVNEARKTVEALRENAKGK